MKNIIYLKYGELVLKGKNKINFINRLFDNVKQTLKHLKKVTVYKRFDGIEIHNITKTTKDKVIQIVKSIPGIALVIEAYVTKKNLKNLGEDITKTLKSQGIKETTFKVNTKRADKNFSLNSMEVSCKIGEIILNNFKTYHVDVHKPQLVINVEIKQDVAIFYFNKIKGRGGFPVGINGKVLMLISGGIDSPVAASLLIKKGIHVDFLTFISPPHTKIEALHKVEKLCDVLTLNKTLYKSKLFVVNFTKIQHEISHITNHSYQITLMRRYFFRLARDLAKQYGYQAIATGESLGQVASQTLESMKAIEDSVNNFLVLRPLLTYDKAEIIEEAKRLGTFETSILPFDDACSLFVPTNPITKPTAHTCAKLESELSMMDAIYDYTFKNNIKIE